MPTVHWVFYDEPVEVEPYKYVKQEKCNCAIGHDHNEND